MGGDDWVWEECKVAGSAKRVTHSGGAGACVRAHLQEARGGGVALREGLVSERPYVRLQPVDMEVDEGATVELAVSAGLSGDPVA